MKRKYSNEAIAQFHCAISDDDLDKIQELVEQDKVAITSLECMKVVQENKLLILEYFLQKSTNLLGAFSHGLDEAVIQRNYDALRLMITYFRDNEALYIKSTLDSVIVGAIREVARCETKKIIDSAEALKITKLIVDYYCD